MKWPLKRRLCFTTTQSTYAQLLSAGSDHPGLTRQGLPPLGIPAVMAAAASLQKQNSRCGGHNGLKAGGFAKGPLCDVLSILTAVIRQDPIYGFDKIIDDHSCVRPCSFDYARVACPTCTNKTPAGSRVSGRRGHHPASRRSQSSLPA